LIKLEDRIQISMRPVIHPGYNIDSDIEILWQLLKERRPSESISHTEMPTYEDHTRFVLNRPYLRWYFIVHNNEPVGAAYITHEDAFKQHYVGVAVFKNQRRKGYASMAIDYLKWEAEQIGISLVANINPANKKSIALFKQAGFNIIQHSYKFNV